MSEAAEVGHLPPDVQQQLTAYSRGIYQPSGSGRLASPAAQWAC